MLFVFCDLARVYNNNNLIYLIILLFMKKDNINFNFFLSDNLFNIVIFMKRK